MRAGRAALTTLAGASALWLAAPLVALVRHGSLDDRTRAGWAAEGTTPAAAPAARVLPLRALPAPRPAADDLLPRTPIVRSAVRGTG